MMMYHAHNFMPVIVMGQSKMQCTICGLLQGNPDPLLSQNGGTNINYGDINLNDPPQNTGPWS